MYNIISQFIIAGLFAMIVHEFGHSIVCWYYTGTFLTFHYNVGYLFNVIPIPRFIWYMPKIENYKQRHIAAAGFVVETSIAFLTIFSHDIFWIIYAIVVTAHWFAYPYYCGESNDFKWLQ